MTSDSSEENRGLRGVNNAAKHVSVQYMISTVCFPVLIVFLALEMPFLGDEYFVGSCTAACDASGPFSSSRAMVWIVTTERV
jgi:hypothetical protein